ncbi:MAG: DNA/RNA non-specific endonuclease [Myxococcales bacterium]|nr:DNA/RNA non-specific endonuclease [Myxococcales bacterium]
MKPNNRMLNRWQPLVALCTATILALATAQVGWADVKPEPPRVVGITAAPIKGMPAITSADAAAWEQRLPATDGATNDNATPVTTAKKFGISERLRQSLLAGDVDGMNVAGPRLGAITQQLATRGAGQARLGIPTLTKNFGDKLMVKNVGRFVSIIADVTPIAETPGTIRAGTVVTMWMTKDPDVDGPALRPDNTAWRGPDVPRDWKTNELQDDFRGLFQLTKLSRGHIMPSAEATQSRADQMATFAVNDNAFPQAEYSNAGVYRDAEKSFQRIAADGDYEIYNYAGPVWSPVTYTDVHGKTVTVKSEVLTHNGKRAPKPAGFFRVGIIVPNKDASGRALSLGEALQFARPISIIAPNVQDPFLMVSGIKPFIKTAQEVQAAVGIELFTHLADGPNAAAIRQALLTHRDSGDALPGELMIPPWKVELLKIMSRQPGRIGELAARKLTSLPHEPKPPRKPGALAPKQARIRGPHDLGGSRQSGAKSAAPQAKRPRIAAPRAPRR